METVTIPKPEYEKMQTRVSELEALVSYYEGQIRLARHRQFGSSSEKSEYDMSQLSLFNEAEVVAEPEATAPQFVEVEKHYRKRTRLVTDKLPDDLPVEVIEHTLPEGEQTCGACGSGLHIMGHETRRELVIIPASVKIREHRQAVYACRHCEQTDIQVPIQKAPMPPPVISGSFASPEAVAHVANQKFVMGVPLYRQEQEWQRQGIMLSRQTMSNWLMKIAGDWLEPFYEHMRSHLLQREVLHADESTL